MPVYKKNPKNAFLPLFGPFFGPNLVKMTKKIFFLILMLNHFQRRVTCLCLNKTMKIGIFGPKMACRAQKKPENFGKP